MRAPVTRPLYSGNALFGAALSAPGLAAIAFMLGGLATALASSGGLNGLASALINLTFLVLIVTVWGFFPSLVFGGLVLAVIHRITWRGPPTTLVFVSGGIVAAGLYVLTGLGVAKLSPTAALLLAPWAMRDFIGPDIGRDDLWLLSSLLLAGAAAGLIYSAFAKRG